MYANQPNNTYAHKYTYVGVPQHNARDHLPLHTTQRMYWGRPEHIHVRSINEQSHVSRASREPNIAFSNGLFAHLLVRGSLSSAVVRSLKPTEQVSAAISPDTAKPSKLDRLWQPQGFSSFLGFLKFPLFCCVASNFIGVSCSLAFTRFSRAGRADLGAAAPKTPKIPRAGYT